MKRITAILTAALLAMTLSLPVLAEPDDSSTEESVVSTESTESAEESAEEDNKTENSEDEESPEDSKEENNEDSKNDSSESEENSKKTSKEESAKEQESSVTDVASMKFNEYRIKEAEMTISLPDEMFVLTREIDEDDPVLKKNKLTKDEVLDSFEKNNTYLNASTKDYSYDVTVTIIENEDTKTIGSLSDLTESELQKLTDNLLESKIFTGCSKTYYQNTLFLTLNMEQQTSNTNIKGLQEYTIIKGRCVKIIFQSYTGDLDEIQRDIFTRVMNSVVFDGIDPVVQESVEAKTGIENLDIRYIYIIVAAAVGLIALLIMITVGVKYKKSKKNRADHQEEEEEEIEIDFPDKNKNKTTRLIPAEDKAAEKDSYDAVNAGAKKMTFEDLNETDINAGAKKMTFQDLEKTERIIPRLDEQQETENTVHDFINEKISVTETPAENDVSGAGATEELNRPEEPDGYKVIHAIEFAETPSYSSRSSYAGRYGEHSGRFTYDAEPTETYEESRSYDALFGSGRSQSDPVEEYQEPTEEHDYRQTDEDEDEIVFAESAEPRRTVIEQIGTDAQDTETVRTEDTDTETDHAPEEESCETTDNESAPETGDGSETEPEESEEELSAYEKRFGKSRTTPPATIGYVAASPEINIVNTSEKRTSKFEKHFGKLTPAVPMPEPEPEPIPEPVPEPVAEPVTEPAAVSPVREEPAKPETTDVPKAASSGGTESIFARLLERLKNNQPTEPEPEPEFLTQPKEETTPETTESAEKTETAPAEPQEAKPVDENEPLPDQLSFDDEVVRNDTEPRQTEKAVPEKPAAIAEAPVIKAEEKPVVEAPAAQTEAKPAVEAPGAQTEKKPAVEVPVAKTEEKTAAIEAPAAQTEEQPAEKAEEKAPENSDNVIYSAEEPKKNTDKGTIELEISKSADGSLVIGALNEVSGKPVNIEIRDASHFKEDRDREMAELGLETANENEIYNAHKIENDENPFIVKPKETAPEESVQNTGSHSDHKTAAVVQESKEETGSRFDKLFGAGRDKAKTETVSSDTTGKTSSVNTEAPKASRPEEELSAFEKKFGKTPAAPAVTAPASAPVTPAASAPAVSAAGVAVGAAAIGTAAAAGAAAVAAVFDKASESKGKKQVEVKTSPAAPETKPEASAKPAVKTEPQSTVRPTVPVAAAAVPVTSKAAPTKPETVEEFLDGTKADTMAAETEKHVSKRDIFDFERDSGIIFEHAAQKQSPVMPMQTVFTRVPKLESVNAEEYHKQYDDMKSNMSKNQAYAQRFGNVKPVQPFVETPKPIAKPEQPAKAAEAPASAEPSKKSKKNKNNKSHKNPKNTEQPKNKLKEEDKIEYYKGYEENASDPFGVAVGSDDIIIKDHKKKNNDSVGTRFKKSIGKIFSNEDPEGEN